MDRTILLIDTDLGFLFWLGSTLDQAGFEAFPARTIPDAITLIAQLHLGVGMLIMNFALTGAEEFVREMRRSNPRIKVVSLVCERPGSVTAHVDAVCFKPEKISEHSQAELLALVQRTFLPNVMIS